MRRGRNRGAATGILPTSAQASSHISAGLTPGRSIVFLSTLLKTDGIMQFLAVQRDSRAGARVHGWLSCCPLPWTSTEENPSPGHHSIHLVFFIPIFFPLCRLTSLDFWSLCSEPWLLHTTSPSTALTSNRIILLPQLIGRELSGFNAAINFCSLEGEGQERGRRSSAATNRELINANEFTGITAILQPKPGTHIATHTRVICLQEITQETGNSPFCSN